MHELSVCRSLISQVNDIALSQNAILVDKIHLRVGPLSGVVPDLLQSAFPFVSVNTVAAKAQLLIHSVPIEVECNVCHARTQASSNKLLCGQCGDWHTTLLSGDELILERIELEMEASNV